MHLLSGIDIDSIRVVGRWVSNAFDRYWRNIKSHTANHRVAEAEYVSVETEEAATLHSVLGGR